MVGKQWRQRAKTAGFYGLVILFMLPTAFVFYWMVTLSLKPQIEAAAFPPIFFNFSITFKGYVEVFAKHPFLLYIWNSLVVAAGTTLLGLIVGLPAAYSIAQWKQQRLALTILVARIIPGISYLIEGMKQLGDVIVVAPDKPQSAMGHAITINEPIRLTRVDIHHGVDAWQSSGTPVDCVKLAIDKLLPRKPDLMVSGINHGSNSSINVIYSGTMSAAVEAAIDGMKSIGFSQFLPWFTPNPR